MPRTKKTAAPTTTSPADLMAQINAVYPGSTVLASHPDLYATRTPTGDDPLDFIFDGGIPRGRMIELYGPYSTMKSYAAYRAIAAHQQAGKKVALVDYEHSWDPDWGTSLGIDVKTLYVARPVTAEDGIGILNILILQGYDLVVWDSIAAAQPKQLREAAPGSKEDMAPAALARVMSRGLARLTASNKHTSLIFINQTRATIGVTFGPQSATSGGKAMGYYASMRVSFTRTGKITETVKVWDGENWVESKKVLGHKIKATLEKSKLSTPYSEVHFVYDLQSGTIDGTGWLIGEATARGLIQRSATGHHTIPGVLDKSIHGAGAFRAWVDQNEEVVEWMRDEILPK